MADTDTRWSQKRMLIRTDKPASFFPLGFIGAAGLVCLLVFGLIPFAFNWIQDTARTSAHDALKAANIDWVKVSVSGQRITLEGEAPSNAARTNAEQIVRQARYPAMFGIKARPVTHVHNKLSVASTAPLTPAAQTAVPHNWSFVLNASILELDGDVPDKEAEQAITDAAELQLNPPRLTKVRNKLRITNRTAEPGFTETALRGINTLTQCNSGTAAYTGAEFRFSCETETGREHDITSLAREPLSYGKIGRIDVFTRQAVDACNQTLLNLLNTTKIQFGVDSALIDAASGPVLDELASAASSCPGDLRIEGHSDDSGRSNLNDRLSRRRAEAVRRALIARGVGARRLKAEGFGSSRPIADNTSEAGKAQNRRIEIKVVTGGN